MGMRDFFWKVSDFLQVTNPKPFNIIASRDGKLYEVRDHAIGRLIIEKDYVRELDQVVPGFQFELPKIPGDLLTKTIAFFSHFVSEDRNVEVMVQIFWDTKEKKYFLECPYQRVSKVSVQVSDYPILHDPRYVQVMHIHSHNTMDAYFSRIDDEDEKAMMMYGVIGRLDQETPDIKLRVGCNGKFITLPLNYIFDEPGNVENTFPDEWLKRVKISKK